MFDYEYIIETPNLPLDRQMYILLKLTTKKYITVGELEESIYVFEATVNNDISIISKYWNYLFKETDVILVARDLYHIVSAS